MLSNAILVILFFECIFTFGLEMEPYWIGCLRSDESNSIMKDKFELTMHNMEHKVCENFCYKSETTFFALKGDTCRCFNDLQFNMIEHRSEYFKKAIVPISKLSNESCDAACSGDPHQTCGSVTNRAFTVFTVCGMFSWGRACQRRCMCESMFCPILTGMCLSQKCAFAAFSGPRCDYQHGGLFEELLITKDRIQNKILEALFDMPSQQTKDEVCMAGKYSQGCSLDCHCLVGRPGAPNCDHETGVCLFSTECVEGWIGARCDVVKPCFKNPCLFGGKCIIVDQKEKCVCIPPYEGRQCEILDGCTRHSCLNEGMCLSNGSERSCQCVAGFTGLNCEISTDNILSSNMSSARLGCFSSLNDAVNQTSNSWPIADSANMGKNMCTDHCRSIKFTYAAISDANCFCSQDLPTRIAVVSDKFCDATCADAEAGPNDCGGSNALTVYTACGKFLFGESCDQLCMCLFDQCNIVTGFCSNGDPCLPGYTGPKCNNRLSTPPYMYISVFILVFLVVYMLGMCILTFFTYYDTKLSENKISTQISQSSLDSE